MDLSTWETTFRINLTGTMLCCKYALPHMPRHAGACIINTASNTGLLGYTMLTAYGCTKAAIMQLTRTSLPPTASLAFAATPFRRA